LLDTQKLFALQWQRGDIVSISALNAAYASHVSSPTQKAVMNVLANYANQDHECWPSIPTMMRATAFSERAIRLALRALEASGLIVRRVRVNSLGQTTSSAYFLAFVLMPAESVCAPGREGARDAPPPVQMGEGATDAAPGGHVVPGEGARVAPKPLLKPLVQPPADARAREAIPPGFEIGLFGDLVPIEDAPPPPVVVPTPAVAQPVRDTPQQPAPPGYKLPFNRFPQWCNFAPIPPEPSGDPKRWMPRLSDPEHRWACLAPGEEIDPRSMNGARKQMRGGCFLRDIAWVLADALGWNDLARYTDWRPLCAWLDDGIDPHDTIVPTIRAIVARRGNLEISTLAYFDRAVREAATGGNRRVG